MGFLSSRISSGRSATTKRAVRIDIWPYIVHVEGVLWSCQRRALDRIKSSDSVNADNDAWADRNPTLHLQFIAYLSPIPASWLNTDTAKYIGLQFCTLTKNSWPVTQVDGAAGKVCSYSIPLRLVRKGCSADLHTHRFFPGAGERFVTTTPIPDSAGTRILKQTVLGSRLA